MGEVHEVTELITPGPAEALAGLLGVPCPGEELPLLWHWVYLLDRPGSLHQLTRILTDCEANIVQTSHNRSYYGVNLGDTVIEITLETRGAAHIAAIADALSAAGYRHERVH